MTQVKKVEMGTRLIAADDQGVVKVDEKFFGVDHCSRAMGRFAALEGLAKYAYHRFEPTEYDPIKNHFDIKE
jgi:hypothetical protein